MVFKMTNTHNLTEWFKSRFGWHVVALMRHPLSQSLSVMNLNAAVGGWDSRAPGFFRSQEYCEEHLDDEQVALAHDVWKGGNELDRQVLGWGLENLPLVRGLPRYRHWSFVSYEAMVLDADALLHALAESFDLPDAARMVAVIGQASRSVRGLSVAERQAAIRRRDTQALLGSWRRRIDIADETRAFGILERLGLDLYRAGSDVPSQLWYTPTTRATEAVAPVGTDSIVQ
ncbi:MAG: hypothetical protein EA356_02980 [Geminicoccaceae bacterium]|nr:MAG: hypothetical protein EA356_02980 [Geminicoccaceae bacterium]